MLRATLPNQTGISELCLGDGGVGGLFFVNQLPQRLYHLAAILPQ